MNTKLHAVTDAEGRPIQFVMTAGEVTDYMGTAEAPPGYSCVRNQAGSSATSA